MIMIKNHFGMGLYTYMIISRRKSNLVGRMPVQITKDKENKTVELKEFPTENNEKAQGERKEKILKTCKNFCEWIFEAPNEEIDDQVKILNELQIIKRTRNFSPNEIEKLYKMIENSKT